MDKKDVMYLGAALVLVLIIALVIKPLATGQPINTGIPVPTTTQQVTDIPAQSPGAYIQSHMTTTTPVPATSPTPLPTWNPSVTQAVGFVDPSVYGVSSNQSGPTGTRFNITSIDTSMTTFATIQSSPGSSGTTKIFYIPFPYWELVYTIEPKELTEPDSIEVTATHGIGPSFSGIKGSYSTVAPQFTIQVMDGDDPNRIVRTISPPGGIDLALWMGEKGEVHENSQKASRKYETITSEEVKAVDPRPWTEKFYEGQRNYYFIITAQSLQSYSMDIKFPTRYIGKY